MFGEKVEDYEILEHLGKGGFAHVYRARCRNTNLFVAIKMIDKALMASAGMIGRVRQEVTIHSRLKHPAILELFTFFEDVHYVYLVLELAHNGELAKHFKLGTRGLSEKAAADIFKQVVSGVLYLHTHNIIHRDLSLNNLLVTKDLNVKIADFGLATQLNGPDEKHVTMCGTPNYISPEVASRKVHGLPADVWGLGCMLYTLLVGSPPFHTQHVKTTLNRVINADYKIPCELSFNAQDMLQNLLCKDPRKRITLKEIMEHPFLNNNMNSCPSVRQDVSRDSGFLTTLHSTQHSSKQRSEVQISNDYPAGCMDNELGNFINKDNNVNPGSFNVFGGICGNNATASSNNGFNLCSSAHSNNRASDPLHSNVSKQSHSQIIPQAVDPVCNNSALLIENVNKLVIKNTGGFQDINTPEYNKENNPKIHNTNSTSLNVPPLCADRLPPISHKTRNAILKIDPSAVIVEFIKKKGKDREEKVAEICNISKDGMKIVIYNVEGSKVNKHLNDLESAPNETFSYHNLPQKHWKKYLYASRFVDLVKAKTPKITLYSTLAKCQLMENGTDIDMFFYTGEKLTFKTTDGIKVIDKNLKTHHNPNAVTELKYITNHFEECSNRMKRIQTALSGISDECFPLIIGKRPIQAQTAVASPHQPSINVNYNTPLMNIGSFNHTTASSSRAQSDYPDML